MESKSWIRFVYVCKKKQKKKTDLKNATRTDASSFAKKTDLARITHKISDTNPSLHVK